jgi:AcrR family transcriptional regulator
MPGAHTDKRTRLIQAAAKLTYRRGFAETSLADIAHEARVPLGNIYYYFKTKDEIGAAIVEHRLSQTRAQRHAWDEVGPPKDRLRAFVRMTLDNRETLARGGCPIGTLCAELHKDGGPLARQATILFAELLDWIETQFRALGKGAESRVLAVHLLSALEGVSLLAHSFHDPDLVIQETSRLDEWIRTL